MKLVGKVPVEPLDDERLTNIERKLVVQVSELSRRHEVRAPRRLLAFAGVAYAVALAGFVGWKVRGEGAPVAPQVERYAMKDGALDLGDAQITGTDFAVTRTPALTVVDMQPGRLDLHVDHQPGRLFVVKAGNVEIEDIGTRFSVDYDGKHVEVRVTEGEVKVKHAGKDEVIAAGDAWTVELGRIAIAQLDEVQAAEAMAIVMADASLDHAAPAGDGGNTPATTGNDANSTNSGGSTANSPSGPRGSSGASRKPRKSDARKALEKAGYAPPIDAGTDDPKQAIAKYLELAKSMPEGEDKAQLLYGIAVMQHRAKQDSAAKHTLKALLRRQGGASYEAARWLEVRITCMKAFDDECRIAAQKYIAAFESGPRAGIAVDILKEISRGP